MDPHRVHSNVSPALQSNQQAFNVQSQQQASYKPAGINKGHTGAFGSSPAPWSSHGQCRRAGKSAWLILVLLFLPFLLDRRLVRAAPGAAGNSPRAIHIPGRRGIGCVCDESWVCPTDWRQFRYLDPGGPQRPKVVARKGEPTTQRRLL